MPDLMQILAMKVRVRLNETTFEALEPSAEFLKLIAGFLGLVSDQAIHDRVNFVLLDASRLAVPDVKSAAVSEANELSGTAYQNLDEIVRSARRDTLQCLSGISKKTASQGNWECSHFAPKDFVRLFAHVAPLLVTDWISDG
jgi:hypothetical protein